MLICEECEGNEVYINLSVNVNDFYAGELHDADLGETICNDCGKEGVLGWSGTKERVRVGNGVAECIAKDNMIPELH